MISVIVPIYNSEKYLTKCIESIISQTYKDLDIILVNDGSTDNSGKICDEFAKADDRVRVIHQENKGQATARNVGIDAAKGTYITFIDSDDYIEQDTYELMLSLLEKNNCDISMCGHIEVKQNEVFVEKNNAHDEILDIEALWQEIFGRLNNAVWNKLFRRELIDEIRFPIGMIHGEDLIFNLNYLIKCKKGVINRSKKYYYVQHAGSVTNSYFSEKKITEMATKDLALDIVKNYHPAQLKNAEKYCFRARMNVIRSIYKSKQERQYLTCLNDCNNYIAKNYSNIKKFLKFKEKIEYLLYTKLGSIYKLIVFYI